MKRKILFIFAFALLLLIFLNNNSFGASSNDLPSYVTSRMSSSDLELFNNNSDYYLLRSNVDNTKFQLLFYNSQFSTFVSNSNFYYVGPLYYAYFSSSYSCSSLPSGTRKFFNTLNECPIIQANYDVYDSNTGDLFFSATPPVFYTITYNLNGGTGNIHTDVVQEGNSVNLWSGSSFSPPEDKTFVGWATSSSATSSDVISPYTPTGDITLYAVYEYNTSGIISGIRNLINSITSGFSSISNFLNPNSVDTSNAESSINDTTTDIKNKFNFTDSIKENIDDMINVITNTESAPTFTINVSSERYTGEVTVIDLNWYAPFKSYGDTVICVFAYVSFLWHMFLKIPSIIHGGDASSFSSTKNNFDFIRR